MREGGAGGKGRAPGLCLTPNLLCAEDTKETITDKGDPPTSETPEMLTFQLGGSDRKLFSHFVSSRLNSGTECTPSSPTAHTCPFFLGRPPPASHALSCQASAAWTVPRAAPDSLGRPAQLSSSKQFSQVQIRGREEQPGAPRRGRAPDGGGGGARGSSWWAQAGVGWRGIVLLYEC